MHQRDNACGDAEMATIVEKRQESRVEPGERTDAQHELNIVNAHEPYARIHTVCIVVGLNANRPCCGP